MENIRAIHNHIFKQTKAGLSVLAIILFIPIMVNAQTLEAGAFVGAAYYLGDLNPGKHFTESDLAFGGLLKYNLNERLSIGLTATQASIKSDASTYKNDHPEEVTVENLDASITELALIGELNFFRFDIKNKRDFWTPYIFGGGAYFVVSDSTSDNHFSIPFGAGIKVSPVKKVGLNFFWSARKTFTDDIDKITSIDYKGYNEDWYFFYGLNITFAIRLQKKKDCRNVIHNN